jgi:hypothetical protein
MSNEIESALLYGHLTNVDGKEIDVIGDIEKLYSDELDIVSRTDIMKRIGITALGIVGTAFYYGNQNRELAIKALYALFAAGLGINVGVAASDSRVDAAAAAGIYFAFSKASYSLNMLGQNRTLGYESLAAFLVGIGYDFYVRKQMPKQTHKKKN